MVISLVQCHSRKGDLESNFKIHSHFIELSAKHQTNVILFPELSFTGYEPKLAPELSKTDISSYEEAFSRYSSLYGLVIAVGMPVDIAHGTQIAMKIYYPDGRKETYAKQILHLDEIPYFVPGSEQVVIKWDNLKLLPGICFETSQETHFKQCIDADVYLVSVAKKAYGIKHADSYLAAIAKKYKTFVTMANSVGPNDDFISAGGSAVWIKDGNKLLAMDNESEGLLLFNTETQKAYIDIEPFGQIV